MEWSSYMWKKIKELFFCPDEDLEEDIEKALWLTQYIHINYPEDDCGIR